MSEVTRHKYDLVIMPRMEGVGAVTAAKALGLQTLMVDNNK